MDDQRGELGKHSFELPDFLRLPQTVPTSMTENETSPPPPPPPPPPVGSPSRYTTGSLKVKGETRRVVRKTLSTPANGQADLMTELADRLRRRSTSDTLAIPEGHESEGSVDSGGKRSESCSSKERSTSPWEPRSEHHRRINIVRPKTCTDGAVFTVEAVTPVRLDSPLSHSRVPISHSESMPDTLQTRTRSTQPLTVNSIRGLPSSTSNVNRIDEQTEPEKNVRVVHAIPVQKYHNSNC